ncbi:hypothetical protein G7092_02815 [Mucilaginibacter sp. HC2]|uniref:hypothetical protein n=1 Tax=Mucilaginibacter inviolabilis TaxID=2714892 RepID=UPI00140AE938|nr:hypothetical protein [Mucilaginibacter inviolabilis]NHA02707.1 hypothetical protein [Mucilaginibacter inviolabilis]
MKLTDDEYLNAIIENVPLEIAIIDAVTFKIEVSNDNFPENEHERCLSDTARLSHVAQTGEAWQ